MCASIFAISEMRKDRFSIRVEGFLPDTMIQRASLHLCINALEVSTPYYFEAPKELYRRIRDEGPRPSDRARQ